MKIFIILGCGTGVMRLMWADKDAEANLVPVDMVVNALLCGAYDVAKNYNNDSTLVKNNVENISEPVTKK